MLDHDGDVELLKSQINKLNFEINKKNQEINLYLDKLNDYEEELMKLHELISKTPPHIDIEKIIEAKFNFELKDKEREIRDLKNRMGFLRQEKINFQRELSEFKKKSKPSKESIEEIREKQNLINALLNRESLTNELRKKLYTQEIITGNLRKEIEGKDDEIEYLKLLIKELNEEIRNKNSIIEGTIDKKIKSELKNKWQNELKKSKELIEDLTQELNKYRVFQKDKILHEIQIRDLQNKINLFEKELVKKDKIINELKLEK
ncbi:MAG: hypothetical protein ACFFB0_06555 [Promethearchaeota archaeon]